MNIISLCSSLFLISCCLVYGQQARIISPQERCISLPYQDVVSITTEYDTIAERGNSFMDFIEVGRLWIIAAESGVYCIDAQSKEIRTYFKFAVKSHQELFHGIGSQFSFTFVKFFPNKAKDKLLVTSSNGVVFQIDIKASSVDWLIKFSNGITTASYSDNGKLIAIGAKYEYKGERQTQPKEYYSSVFLLNSQTGQITDYFQEAETVRKVLFKDADTTLLVAYPSNNHDSFLWNVSQKDKPIAKYWEQDALLYDLCIVNDSCFITANSKGITKWDIHNPEQRNRVFSRPNSEGSRVIKNTITNGYLFIRLSNLVFLDEQFHRLDTLKLPYDFEEIQQSSKDSIVILSNAITIFDKDKNAEGFYYFNVVSKDLQAIITEERINTIIKSQRH